MSKIFYVFQQHLSEGSRVQQNLSHSLQQLEKAKKNYEKAFREAEKVRESMIENVMNREKMLNKD